MSESDAIIGIYRLHAENWRDWSLNDHSVEWFGSSRFYLQIFESLLLLEYWTMFIPSEKWSLCIHLSFDTSFYIIRSTWSQFHSVHSTTNENVYDNPLNKYFHKFSYMFECCDRSLKQFFYHSPSPWIVCITALLKIVRS